MAVVCSVASRGEGKKRSSKGFSQEWEGALRRVDSLDWKRDQREDLGEVKIGV